MKRLHIIISIVTLFLCFSCSSPSKNKTKDNKSNTDSIEITNLLKDVYKWYRINESYIYFDVIVKDSFQVGLDTLKLKDSIDKLKGSNYFSSAFIENYKKIGLAVDNKLRNGKYYNEINFSFQDADIWTSSQDDDIDLWKKLLVKDLIVRGEIASLKWYTDNKNFGYLVKMKKENGTWIISYLEGLDYKNIIE
jgi:hypothetical protein